MNKVKWFNGRELTPGDLDAMQTAPETLIGRHAALSSVGHISGVRVTAVGNNVRVGAGVAVDLQGRAIVVPAAVALDLSTFVRPSTGRYRWLAVAISYATSDRGTSDDGGGDGASGRDRRSHLRVRTFLGGGSVREKPGGLRGHGGVCRDVRRNR